MILMDKKNTLYSNFRVEEGDVDVDEMIAIPIQALNKKGYKTQFSCSGHYFDEREEGYMHGMDKVPMDIYVYQNNYDAYILFDKVYAFPTIPEGWEYKTLTGIDPEDPDFAEICKYDRGRLGFSFPEEEEEDKYSFRLFAHNNWSEYVKFTMLQIEVFTKLMEWISTLPDISESTEL